MTDCLFCRIAAGEIPATQVYQDEHCVAFNDIKPGAPTHVLIIPRQHIAQLDQASAKTQNLLGHLLLVANKVAELQGLNDFRVVINNGAGAGQSVFHLHLHVLGGRELGWPPG